MTKLEYAEEVCKCINKHGFETIITENAKNNGSYISITVKKSPDEPVAPVFNIGDTEDRPPEEFADYILSFVPAKIDTDSLQDIMFDKEKLLSRVHYILVNMQMNRSRTSLVRRQINKTLELHYKVDISDIMPDARITLEQKHIEKLGITEDEVYIRSYINTPERFPYELSKMNDVLNCDWIDEVPMYVLTNKFKTYGAGTILYKGMREVLDNTVGECVAIPSSVHEWIIIPTKLGEKETLITMIREVNSTVLQTEDILSDRPYELISDGVLFEI